METKPHQIRKVHRGLRLGEDLFNMRRVVREKATAIIQARKLEVPATQALRGAALQGKLSEAPLEPSSFNAIQD